MIKFAVLRGIDRIFMDISSPHIYTAQNIDNLSTVISFIPKSIELGAVLEALPTGDFKISNPDINKIF